DLKCPSKPRCEPAHADGSCRFTRGFVGAHDLSQAIAVDVGQVAKVEHNSRPAIAHQLAGFLDELRRCVCLREVGNTEIENDDVVDNALVDLCPTHVRSPGVLYFWFALSTSSNRASRASRVIASAQFHADS